MGLLKSLRSAIHKKRNFSRKQRGGNDGYVGHSDSNLVLAATTLGGKRKRRRRRTARRHRTRGMCGEPQ